MDKVRILNLDIQNSSFTCFVESLERGVVVTPNVDHLMKLQKDADFYSIYIKAEHIVCDSRIIQWASKMLYPGRGIIETIAGSDLLPAFCRHHRENTDRVRIFLLGGTPESVIFAQNSINRDLPKPLVVGAYSPPFGFEANDAESEKIVGLINESGANTLAVGVGAPKQEKWIYQHRAKLPGVDLYFAIGAAIDFEAGVKKRAPAWMSKFGIEWLYRLIQEPRRLTRRYLVDDLPFFWLVLKQRLGLYRNPWKLSSQELRD